MPELYGIGRVFHRIRFRKCLTGFGVQHIGDPLGTGGGLGQVDDHVGHLHQLHQNLGHVVIQRHKCPLGDDSGFYPESTGVNQDDDGKIDNDVGDGVHQSGDPAHIPLQGGETFIPLVKGFPGGFFHPESPDKAGTGETFPGGAQNLVQPGLYLFVQRHGNEHDTEYNDTQYRDGYGENQGGGHINGKRHHHGPEHHERRAKQQAQGQIHPGLHLIHVACESGDQCGSADFVKSSKRQRLDMGKKRMADPCGKPYGCLGGEKLCRNGADHTDEPQQHQDAAVFPDGGCIAIPETGVNDGSHHQRHQKLKGSFQQLEQRAEDTFLHIRFQILQKFFQEIPPW